MRNDMVSNSLFRVPCSRQKTLLLVPHEDDEILTAGNLLYSLAEAGSEVYIVFATNGDWKYNAEIRFHEAVQSAEILGVPADHIIFLGYGDSAPGYSEKHIFYHWDNPTQSPAGFSKTYGTEQIQDFSFQYRGYHSDYTAQNYLIDLMDSIVSIKPDFIICSDLDEHPDHKMLSLSFDRAIGIIRKQYPDYTPRVWKRFAYSLSYNSAPDYTAVNNSETLRPKVGITAKYTKDIIDTSIYRWEDRIRIPVIDTEKQPLWRSTIGRALLKHKSQYIIRNADRIMNSDEIYWSRRTDGIGYSAKIETSSGDGRYLNDFMLMNVCDIDSSDFEYMEYCWKPEDCDKDKTATFSWEKGQTIERIVIYSAITEKSQIEKLQIKLSNGQFFTLTDIPNNGNPVSIDIGHCEGITSCEITILNANGDNYGLSECEFYASSNEPRSINPFIKILINDNFAYEYVIPESERQLQVGLYSYGVERSTNQIKVVEGQSVIVDNCLVIDPMDRVIVLRAENGLVWDQVMIRIASQTEMNEIQRQNRSNQKYLKRQRSLFRVHNMLYMLKRQGVVFVLKRTAKNGVLGRLRE